MGILEDILKEAPLSAVLRERVQLAEDRFRRADEETTGLKLQLAEAQKEIRALRDSLALQERQSAVVGDSKLPPAAEKVLTAVVVAQGDDKDVGAISAHLGMSRAVVEAHLDDLKSRGFARLTSSNHISGHVYWSPLPAGRKYALDNNLIT